MVLAGDQRGLRGPVPAPGQDLEGLDPRQALCAAQGRLLHQPARILAGKDRPQAHGPGPGPQQAAADQIQAVRGPGAGQPAGGPARRAHGLLLEQPARKDPLLPRGAARTAAQGAAGQPAQLPAAGPVLSQLPVGIRLRRHPGRRDGPGQDRADPGLHPAYGGEPLRGPQPHRGAHLGAAQLGARSGKVRARPAPPDHLRHAPRGHVQAHRGIGPHHHHLRPAAA